MRNKFRSPSTLELCSLGTLNMVEGVKWSNRMWGCGAKEWKLVSLRARHQEVWGRSCYTLSRSFQPIAVWWVKRGR